MEKAKRPRPQFSCTPCRNRKLKCDRESPCSNCTKGNRVGECTIPAESRPAKRSRQSSEDPKHVFTNRSEGGGSSGLDVYALNRASRDEETSPGFQQLLSRIRALEDVVFAGRNGGSISVSEIVPATPGGGTTESLNVDGSRVRYQGGLHRYALIEGFAEVRAFIPKAIHKPKIAQAMKDLQQLQKSRCIKIDLSRRKVFANHDDLRAKIMHMLQLWPREVYLELVDQYFLHWESLFRIVHTTRMRILINTSWTENGLSGLDIVHLLQILLMITIGGQSFSEKNILNADFVGDVYATVQGYLDTCSYKTKQELSTLQVWTLLILCQHVYLVLANKVWLQTANLIRHAMAIGLHRDPSESKNIPPWPSELRRRLWATILELDLQASLSYGMPMAVTVAETSCRPPLNIADSEIKHDVSKLPEPSDQWTNVSLQRKLAQSSGLRMRVVQLLARRGAGVDWIDVQSLSKEISRVCCENRTFADWCEAEEESQDSLGELMYKTHVWQIYCQVQQQLLALARPSERDRISSELDAGAIAVARLASRAVKQLEHGVDTTLYRGFLALSRRVHLQAAFQLCSIFKLVKERQAPEWRVSRMAMHGHNLLDSLIEALPWGDVKDVLLFAISLRIVQSYSGNEDKDDASMEEELMAVINTCRTKLEALPSRKPENQAVPTPASSGVGESGDLFTLMEEFDFADFGGLDLGDDWQASIWQ